jgi:hypothetical protein
VYISRAVWRYFLQACRIGFGVVIESALNIFLFFFSVITVCLECLLLFYGCRSASLFVLSVSISMGFVA